MLLLIATIGGLLLMGSHSRSESLFYYFRIEDQVPENHLLRLIDRHVSFDFVREKLRESYSDTGRPSIDPEVLLRILLLGYLYGITSERKLLEELRMHLAWRWFTGLGYFDNYLIDNKSCVIVGVQATGARLSQESAAARDMIDRYRERHGRSPKSLAADNTYGNGEMLQWLVEHGIDPYIRVKECPTPTDLYGIDKFTYVPEENCYLCPEGKPLKYTGISKLNRTYLYHSTDKRCRGCSQKEQCTRGKHRVVQVHICEPARQRAYALSTTPGFAISQRARRKVGSAVFGTEEPDRPAAVATTPNQVRA